MPQCPHCMSEIHNEAHSCKSCGAKKGVSRGGVTSGDLKFRAAVVACIGLLPLVPAFGFLVKGDSIGFMLLGILSLIPLGIAASIFFMSCRKEKWYR